MLIISQVIKAYETDSDTNRNCVVVGIELCNEPAGNYFWNQPRGVAALYQEMVPKVREILESDRYSILLSFMDDPS